MGLPKYDGPLGPVPSWLDPAAEVQGGFPERPVGPWLEFVVSELMKLGLTLAQAFEVTAIQAHESGWGQKYGGNNLGGVKATRAWAAAYKRRTGKPAPFRRAKGNKGTGDAQTVIYRAYTSLSDYLAEWVRTFIPRVTGPFPVEPKDADYRRTGVAFWAGEPWVPELIAALYRGSVTAAKPERAIADHALTVTGVRVRWAQSRLGVEVDGKWGPRSRLALYTKLGVEQPTLAACEALAAEQRKGLA